MIKKYKLLYTPTCPNCPDVKKYIKENVDLDGEFIDASKSDGMKEAKKYNVMKAPTVLFFDENSDVACKAHSIEEVKECLSKSQG